MENKQTAMKTLMEWMIEESQVIPVDPGYVYDKAEQLLAMEKEQIKDAWINGDESDCLSEQDNQLFAEQYYNETYGSSKQQADE